jgi:nucleoredoxin
MESFLQSLSNEFVSKNGQEDSSTLKSAHLIGIYFSAHWCPPCRSFTPLLADFYNKVNAGGKVFEVVFVSSDYNEDSFKEYLSTMPWIAVKWGTPEAKSLGNKYKVSGIPRLVIVKPDGNVVVDNGRNDVVSKGIGAWLAWLEKSTKAPFDPQLWDKLTTSGETVKVK